MRLPAMSVCLSACLPVSKITQKRVHAWVWMKFCVSTGVGHGRTDQLLSPIRIIVRMPELHGLLSPISYALQRGILLRRENPTYRYWA